MKRALALLLAVMLIAGMFVGCGGQEAPAEEAPATDAPAETTEEPAAEPLKVSMVTDVGGVNDLSFNQSAWEGLQRSEADFGVDASYLESKQEADYEVNLETLVDEENDLVWGIGFMMAEALKTSAENFPEQKFAIIDNSYGEETPENIVGVTFKEHEPSFLVGYIAGKMTETNKVGFIGGIDFYLINKFEYGFLAGVKAANPDCEVYRQYANSFTDAAAGKSIAEQFYNEGADIIYHAAGATGNGMIEAAKEKGKWAIGVDRDQNDLAPDNVLTSAMKRVDNAIYNVVKDLNEGNWAGGTTVSYGLAEGGVDIAPSSDKHVPAEVLAEVEELKAKIIAGEVVVPENKEQYESFEY
jgi:basic membrane protein A